MAKNNQNSEISAPDDKIKKPKKLRRILQWLLFICIIGCGGYGFLWWQSWQNAAHNQEQALNNWQKKYDEKVAQLTSRIGVLENKTAFFEKNNAQSSADDAFIQDIEAKLIALEEKFAQNLKLADEANSLKKPILPDKETKMPKELLLASGAMVIRDLAERGLSFAYEAEVLSIMAQGNESAQKYVETVKKYASSGIKGKKMLISEFNDLYPQLSVKKDVPAAKNTQSEENNLPWWKKAPTIIWQYVKKLFTSEKVQPLPVLAPENDKVFALVNEGDLAIALNELSTDATYAQVTNEPLRQWIAQVRLYLDFETAINGLLLNALANLHLKEMEH